MRLQPHKRSSQVLPTWHRDSLLFMAFTVSVESFQGWAAARVRYVALFQGLGETGASVCIGLGLTNCLVHHIHLPPHVFQLMHHNMKRQNTSCNLMTNSGQFIMHVLPHSQSTLSTINSLCMCITFYYVLHIVCQKLFSSTCQLHLNPANTRQTCLLKRPNTIWFRLTSIHLFGSLHHCPMHYKSIYKIFYNL